MKYGLLLLAFATPVMALAQSESSGQEPKPKSLFNRFFSPDQPTPAPAVRSTPAPRATPMPIATPIPARVATPAPLPDSAPTNASTTIRRAEPIPSQKPPAIRNSGPPQAPLMAPPSTPPPLVRDTSVVLPPIPATARNAKPSVTPAMISSAQRVQKALPDAYYKMRNAEHPTVNPGFTPVQLVKERAQDPRGVDRCAFVPGQSSFLDAIEGAVRNSLINRPIETNSAITSAKDGYNTLAKDASEEVSLISNPLCEQDAVALAHVLGSEKSLPHKPVLNPDGSVVLNPDGKPKTEIDYVPIETLKSFSHELNLLRETAVDENIQKQNPERARQALAQVIDRYTQFFGCIAYNESLQTTGEIFKPDDVAGFEKNQNLESVTYAVNEENFQTQIKKYPGAIPYFAVNGVAKRPVGVQFETDRPGEYDDTLGPKKPRAYELQNKSGLTDAELKELEKIYFAKFNGTAVNSVRFNELIGKTPLSAAEQTELEGYYRFKQDLLKQYPAWPVIGMFQFNPIWNGNVPLCVKQWNNVVTEKDCLIPQTKNKTEAERLQSETENFRALASSGQTFNAWCGAQKIVQSFNSQVNTFNQSGTDLSNFVNGRLKEPADRCVSLAARAGTGRIFAHFGLLRNSTGKNFAKLMSCVRYTIDHAHDEPAGRQIRATNPKAKPSAATKAKSDRDN